MLVEQIEKLLQLQGCVPARAEKYATVIASKLVVDEGALLDKVSQIIYNKDTYFGLSPYQINDLIKEAISQSQGIIKIKDEA